MDLRLDAVIVAIYSGEDTLLVKPGGRQWGFPGGMLREGERPGNGARRKVREETGLSIDGLPLEGLCSIQKHKDHFLHMFGVRLAPGAFADLGTMGPRGHQILLCPVKDLRKTSFRESHWRCLNRVAELCEARRARRASA